MAQVWMECSVIVETVNAFLTAHNVSNERLDDLQAEYHALDTAHAIDRKGYYHARREIAHTGSRWISDRFHASSADYYSIVGRAKRLITACEASMDGNMLMTESEVAALAEFDPERVTKFEQRLQLHITDLKDAAERWKAKLEPVEMQLVEVTFKEPDGDLNETMLVAIGCGFILLMIATFAWFI